MKDKRIRVYRMGFLILNIISVLLISGFIYYTTEVIRRHYKAREFLDSVKAIPSDPKQNLMICILIMGVLCLNFFAREWRLNREDKRLIISLMLDFALSIIIVVILNFNYNGILIMVFANLIVYVKERRAQIALMAVAVAFFLLANYNLLSAEFNLYSIESYIHYYDAAHQQRYLSVYNIINSMNMVIFVMYCVEFIMVQKGTIDEVSTLNDKLEQANKQIQEYAKMSEKMAETRERNRLAREIHDTLGHTLTGIAAGIDACVATIDVAPDLTKKQLETISDVTREGIKEIRRSVNELRPDALERFSLEYAISKMVTDMNAMSDADIYFNSEVEKLKFDEDEENTIYRVIQEGITNAIRHGHAKKIWITMSRGDSEILLEIKDNGIGSKEIKSGFGTKHIKERIGMLGGTVIFDGSKGFIIKATIPIRWGEEYD